MSLVWRSLREGGSSPEKVVVPGCMEQMAVSDRHDASKNVSACVQEFRVRVVHYPG